MNERKKIAVIGGDRRSLAAARSFVERGYDAAVWGFERVATGGTSGSIGTVGGSPGTNILGGTSSGGLSSDTGTVGGGSSNGAPGTGIGTGACTPTLDGVRHCTSLCDALTSCAAVLLPLPASSDGVHVSCPLSSRELKLGELFALLSSEIPIFGGRISDEVSELAARHRLRLCDYYERDELCVLNAIPTAEGAIAAAIAELDTTLHSSRVVVLGYGRIARTLCRTLQALGAKVTACARRPSDFAWMRVEGITPSDIGTLESSAAHQCGGTLNAARALSECDLLFNTVPARLLTYAALAHIREGVPIIDLASKPGGVDFEAARELGSHVVWALSLPGKTAPTTAGRAIADTVLTMLEEGRRDNAVGGKKSRTDNAAVGGNAAVDSTLRDGDIAPSGEGEG